MIVTGNNSKKLFIMVLLLMGLLAHARSHATPLYGGYNGESQFWIEYKVADVSTLLFSGRVFLGLDVNDHRWAKFRISLAPYLVRLEVTYDAADIVSVNYTTLFPWPVQIGREIDIFGEGHSLWWFSVYLVSGVAGVDSDGTSWAETGFPGVSASGSDSVGNQWYWIKILNWLVGWGEDFTIDGELFLNRTLSPGVQEELISLEDRCTRSFAGSATVLLERFTEGEVMEDMVGFSERLQQLAAGLPFAPLDQVGSELDALSDSLAGKVFTGEMRDELQKLLEGFARDTRPQLKKISDVMTSAP